MSEQTGQHTDGTTQGDRRPVAVVTGASSGIGEASARQLAAAGFDVVCAARRTERIEALAAEIGGRAVTCDVTQVEDVERLAREAGDQVDVLFNNAGVLWAPRRSPRPTSSTGARCTRPTSSVPSR
ncbi:SDR family oxidoreductase [Arsenicicoccus piscis]|uniref:SDR family NAD(P)-dependent oxidoreductase n=1 Tax=Arsenicicoccus piscis TaxID=673954 RepID=A0ABQ6HI60_9MICO|nr:hypothetical protein GCM10025862_02260 [Arsenicicoccus piscis]